MNEQQTPKSLPIHRRPGLVALLAGLLVMLISFLSAWYSNGPRYFHEFFYVRADLTAHEKAIESFRETHGRLPETLDEVEFGGMDRPDPWGRRYIYRKEGGSYQVCTYGRDGEPGGRGLDADVCAADMPSLPQPTLWQFLFSSERIEGVLLAVGGSGLAAMLLTYMLRSNAPRRSGYQAPSWTAILITIVTAGFIGFQLAILHVYTGH